MRAYAIDRCGDIADLSLRELPAPCAGAGQVLVAVEAAALNPADLKILTGKDGGKFPRATRFPLESWF